MSRDLALKLAPADPLGRHWATARRSGRLYVAWRGPNGDRGIQITETRPGHHRTWRTSRAPRGLLWLPVRKPWSPLSPAETSTPKKTEKTTMDETSEQNWECGCGRDNPPKASRCGLCRTERGTAFVPPDFRNPEDYYWEQVARIEERYPKARLAHPHRIAEMSIEAVERQLKWLELEAQVACGELPEEALQLEPMRQVIRSFDPSADE